MPAVRSGGIGARRCRPLPGGLGCSSWCFPPQVHSTTALLPLKARAVLPSCRPAALQLLPARGLQPRGDWGQPVPMPIAPGLASCSAPPVPLRLGALPSCQPALLGTAWPWWRPDPWCAESRPGAAAGCRKPGCALPTQEPRAGQQGERQTCAPGEEQPQAPAVAGAAQLENSFAKKVLGILMDTKLNVRQE